MAMHVSYKPPRDIVMRLRERPALQIAVDLVTRYGFIDAHHYAFARGHAYTHFGAVGDDYTQQEWRRVACRIEMLYRRNKKRIEKERINTLRRHIQPRCVRGINVR